MYFTGGARIAYSSGVHEFTPWILVRFVGFVFRVIFCRSLFGFCIFFVAIKLSVFFDCSFDIFKLICNNNRSKNHFVEADNENAKFCIWH
jgi:hypothetical protein